VNSQGSGLECINVFNVMASNRWIVIFFLICIINSITEVSSQGSGLECINVFNVIASNRWRLSHLWRFKRFRLTANMCRDHGGDKNPLMLCPVRICWQVWHNLSGSHLITPTVERCCHPTHLTLYNTAYVTHRHLMNCTCTEDDSLIKSMSVLSLATPNLKTREK